MSTWSAQRVVREALGQNDALSAERRWYEEQLRQHQRDLHQVDGAIEAAWEHLVQVVLPDLAPAALDRAARACHLASIGSVAVSTGMQREAERHRRRIAEVEATPEYAGREGLLAACEVRIAECDESIAPLSEGYRGVFDDRTWARLHHSGYGTPQYAPKWYQLTYYRDWKEADELVERHGPAIGVKDWPALRAKVEEARAAVTTLQAERDAQQARKGHIEGLVRARQDAEQALANLPARQLAEVRGRLRGHLEPLGHEQAAALFPGDPGVVQAMTRLSGLDAKRQYLVQTARNYLQEPRQQVADAIARNERDIAKLSRPKNASRTFPAAQMEKRFRDRGPAVRKRQMRYGDTRTQLIAFDSYDRGRMIDNFLWWDIMTDGRLDGSFIPAVHQHHTQYGAYHDPHAHAVAAVAAPPSRDDDALLIHDGS